jgi:hypothetical protein
MEAAQPLADCPLSLAERLITLAADAGDAGFPVAVEHLIHLADQVLDRPMERRVWPEGELRHIGDCRVAKGPPTLAMCSCPSASP